MKGATISSEEERNSLTCIFSGRFSRTLILLFSFRIAVVSLYSSPSVDVMVGIRSIRSP